jgi:hypothetical protein
MGGLTNKILAAQYKLRLPDPRLLEDEIEKARCALELRVRNRHQVPSQTRLPTPSGKSESGIQKFKR